MTTARIIVLLFVLALMLVWLMLANQATTLVLAKGCSTPMWRPRNSARLATALSGLLCGYIFAISPALAQVAPLAPNQLMANPPGGSGYLSPRALVSAGLFEGASCPTGQLFYNNAGVIGCSALLPGALAVARTSGGIPYFSGSSTWASSAALAANSLVIAEGPGLAPLTPIGLGTTTQVLHGNASGVPSFGPISSSDVSAVLASPPPIGGGTPNTLAGTIGTLKQLLMNGALSGTNTATMNVLDTGTNWAVPGFNFYNTPATMASFGNNAHYGTAIQTTKPTSGSTTTGSWQGAAVNMYGVGGTSADFFTGLLARVTPFCVGGINCGGVFTGFNGVAAIPSSMTPQGIAGAEIDVQSFSSASLYRQGLRIADLSASTGVQASTTDDQGIALYCNGGPCFKAGLSFGDGTGGVLPVSTGGKLITTQANTVSLTYGLDFSNMNAIVPFSTAAIALPTSGNTIAWGVNPIGKGGFISSTATSGGGGNMLFAPSEIALQFAGVTALDIKPGVVAISGTLSFVPMTIAGLLAIACNADAEGQMAFVKDTVGSAAPTFHGKVAGGGSTTVNSVVSCNGASWQYD